MSIKHLKPVKALLLIGVILLALLFLFRDAGIETRLVEESPVIDPKVFLETFEGSWESEDTAQRLAFQKGKAHSQINVHLDTAAHEDDWIGVTITAYAPSQKRWILIPDFPEDTQYSINQLDEN